MIWCIQMICHQKLNTNIVMTYLSLFYLDSRKNFLVGDFFVEDNYADLRISL